VIDAAAIAAIADLGRQLGDLKRAIDGINARAPFVS
jgi:hypothetical protein